MNSFVKPTGGVLWIPLERQGVGFCQLLNYKIYKPIMFFGDLSYLGICKGGIQS